MTDSEELAARLRSAEAELAEARAENERITGENARLRGLLGLDTRPPVQAVAVVGSVPRLFGDELLAERVDAGSPPEAKLALYQSLFAGRSDVYATRWENPRSGGSGWSPAVHGGWAQASRSSRPREYLPLTDEVIAQHLAGGQTIGLYPLLPGDACQLLACDFDGGGWALDALAYLDACTGNGVPAALERSRSGDGAHVWVFFTAPVPAAAARALGASLLREAMAVRAELDLASYDRFFPAQDFLPKGKGSFGNLIALPLHGGCARRGMTVFLDPTTMAPWEDQWAFLCSLPRLSPGAVEKLVANLKPIEAGPGAVTLRLQAGADLDTGPRAPEMVRGELGAMLALERFGLPPALVAGLKHLASLHNPIFYEKERLRLSTWNTPRFIRCYQETLDRLVLPRGLLGDVEQLLGSLGSRLAVSDQRPSPPPQSFRLQGSLSPQQHAAVADLADHDHGVLVAPPGSGKTVMACALLARHAQPTLVLVDRKPLLDQWRQRLQAHLGLPAAQIGQLGGNGPGPDGRDRQTGVVDLAMVQGLARRRDRDLASVTRGYGLVIVDECHHVPAVTFEACVKQIPARRWLGLTATPYRRDGLQAIIRMHCGPIRHQIDLDATPSAALPRTLVVHQIDQAPAGDDELTIQQVFRALVDDQRRTGAICADVADAIGRGRNCLVLSQWAEHVDQLCQQLRDRGHQPLVLKGGMGKKARARVLDALNVPAGEDGSGLLLIATGSYLGEGFDCPRLDTLFLAFPLAFKGRVVQYVGRILRTMEGKHSVEVHDYVDIAIPMLARMHDKRLTALATLGFDTPTRGRRRRGAATAPPLDLQ